jgi:hypothetical protein
MAKRLLDIAYLQGLYLSDLYKKITCKGSKTHSFIKQV